MVRHLQSGIVYQNQIFPSIIMGLNLIMTSRVYEDDISQLDPTSIEKWLSYDDFKNSHNLEVSQILSTFLQNVAKSSTISWWFYLHQLGYLKQWKESSFIFFHNLQQRSLIVFFNIAGLTKLGGLHALELVYSTTSGQIF